MVLSRKCGTSIRVRLQVFKPTKCKQKNTQFILWEANCLAKMQKEMSLNEDKLEAKGQIVCAIIQIRDDKIFFQGRVQGAEDERSNTDESRLN